VVETLMYKFDHPAKSFENWNGLTKK
jgi:hypothetical protein